MIMLRYLNKCSRGRGAWLLMAFTALALELVALWFQHVMLLKPCVLCIYERSALFGVMGAGIVGAIAPKTPLRYVAILIWLYSAWRGIQLTYEHTMIQLHPSPFMTCDFAARFLRGCHWISGFRRSLLLRAIVLKNSGSSCRWKCRNGC
jgi:disulfide bond formation protein DsbB